MKILKIKKLQIVFLLVLANLFLCNNAYPATQPHVEVSVTPKWVKHYSFRSIKIKDKTRIRNGGYYVLVDNQINALNKIEEYNHYAIKLLNENAVEENSRISLNFSPNFQSLTIHNVTIWRNQKPLIQPIINRVKLLQREENLEKFIYDERWTATLLLDDVRIGDIIEYSYTTKGRNPAFKGNIDDQIQIQWSVPVGKQVYRLLWPKNSNITITTSNKIKKEIIKSSYPNYKEYLIERDHYPTLNFESETPSWYKPYEKISFSGISSWKQVVNWGVAHYKENSQSSSITRIANDISRQYPTKLEQASAALHFVQREIRYVGISIGTGSFIPTQPDKTVKRRYGDCKDKTFLLLSILKNLNIEAYPALTHTKYGQNLVTEGAQLNIFNHVLVKVILKNKHYWLETTTYNQLGTVDKIYQPDYGYALVLKEGNTKLELMQQAQPYHKIIYDEVFNMKAGIKKQAMYTIKTSFIGYEAEKFRESLNSKGVAALAKSYINFYMKYYKNIAATKEIIIDDNKKLNTTTVTENYKIDNLWENNKVRKKYYAYFYSNAISPYIKKPKIKNRTTPYRYNYPVNIEQNITVLLPEDWGLKNSTKKINTPFFNFSREISYDKIKNILKLKYKFKSLKKYIQPSDIKEYIKAVNDVTDHLDYSLYSSYEEKAISQKDNQYDEFDIMMIILIIITLMLILSYIEFLVNKQKTPDATDSKYYPVASSKVFLLSVTTYGLYLVYWFYKNWWYVKKRDHSLIMPWARSFFYSFWYYPLYKSISCENNHNPSHQDKAGNFQFAVLASIFLLTMFAENADGLIMYATIIVAAACILPLVEKINHLNTPDSEFAKFNSKWRARHFLFIFIFLSITSYDLLSDFNVIPGPEVTLGKDLLHREIKFMHRIGVLEPDEKLLLFYSDAYINFKNDGNGLTNKGVFSYWKEKGQLYRETARFTDIKDIKHSTEDKKATLKIIRKDNSDFIIYVKNSSELDFYKMLKRYWDKEKSAIN